ncbi:hypothetical protein SDC9_134706 [bioreactor metagenome]|uniref:Uncharacterized protein n=1 Tax=bioreactor metagenome TaxID=1076179 RepID=A0A645DE09_9ZZZZ
MAGAEFRVFRHDAARRAGGPAVFVVKPGEHVELFRGVDALFDLLHEFGAEVGRSQPGPGVHVEAAHPHLFEDTDLAFEFVSVEFAIPRPERRVAVERAGRREKLREVRFAVRIIKRFHLTCPLNEFLGKNLACY